MTNIKLKKSAGAVSLERSPSPDFQAHTSLDTYQALLCSSTRKKFRHGGQEDPGRDDRLVGHVNVCCLKAFILFIYFQSYSHVNVCCCGNIYYIFSQVCCKFFGQVQLFWSCSFGHVHFGLDQMSIYFHCKKLYFKENTFASLIVVGH